MNFPEYYRKNSQMNYILTEYNTRLDNNALIVTCL